MENLFIVGKRSDLHIEISLCSDFELDPVDKNVVRVHCTMHTFIWYEERKRDL